MKKQFFVTRAFPVSGLPCDLEFDPYIPLNFRTFSTPLGCGYLNISDGSSLMDIAIEPGSQMVRSLTIVSAPPLVSWPEPFEIRDRSIGLPALSTSFDGYSVERLAMDFQISVSSDSILVYWSPPGTCDALSFHQHDFLIRDKIWIGAHFRGLTAAQLGQFLRTVEGC